jgi:hypothetical protein
MDEDLVLAGVLTLLWLRREALETRGLLLEMERRFGKRFDSLEGEFATLRITHFGLFKVKPRPGTMSDGHWTVAEIEETPAKRSGEPSATQ